MRTSLRTLLGSVVATASVVACAGKVEPAPGKLEPNGTRTEATHGTREYGNGCATEYWAYELSSDYACKLSTDLIAPNGYRSCPSLCGDSAASCSVSSGSDTEQRIWRTADEPCKPTAAFLLCTKDASTRCVMEGRRPDGLVATGRDAFRDVGCYFAECAFLEGAAVIAFERLVIELEGWGAPAELVERARRAEREERRHVELATALAHRFGRAPAPVVVGEHAPRSLFAMALENAVEGVVRETYGAAAALYRAEHAADPDVARALAEIADDECRHAELSWDLARWAETRLTAAERDAVRAAMREAARELEEQLGDEPPRELVAIAGVAPAASAKRMVSGLREAWASIAA